MTQQSPQEHDIGYAVFCGVDIAWLLGTDVGEIAVLGISLDHLSLTACRG